MVSGQLLGSSTSRLELSRSPEVMKMESTRPLQASLLETALTCLLRLTMVSGKLLGSTSRRLEISRRIRIITSGEQSKIVRLHRKIQLVLFEHLLRHTSSNSRVMDTILLGELGSDNISILNNGCARARIEHKVGNQSVRD